MKKLTLNQSTMLRRIADGDVARMPEPQRYVADALARRGLATISNLGTPILTANGAKWLKENPS